MNKKERAAIETFARHLSATFDERKGGRDAVLSQGAKRIVMRVMRIERNGSDSTRPRLRFDKVVVELLARQQSTLARSVPDGKSVMVTVTAPIRQSGKTALALENRVRPLLARRAAPTEFADTIEGNAVRVRIAKTVAAPKVIGFVHNPGLDTRAFLDAVQSLIAAIGSTERKTSSGKRWLLLLDEESFWPAATYRQILSRLPSQFENILIVLANGRVEFLTDP